MLTAPNPNSYTCASWNSELLVHGLCLRSNGGPLSVMMDMVGEYDDGDPNAEWRPTQSPTILSSHFSLLYLSHHRVILASSFFQFMHAGWLHL